MALVEALAESDAVLRSPELSVGSAKLSDPRGAADRGLCRVLGGGADPGLRPQRRAAENAGRAGPSPSACGGREPDCLTAAGLAPAKLTLITLGEPLRP